MTAIQRGDAYVAKTKEEILNDIQSGRVPADVRSFADLHDYVDANCYGGAEALVDEIGLDAAVNILNAGSYVLDEWIRDGGHR